MTRESKDHARQDDPAPAASAAIDISAVPTFPEQAQLTYLAEGAANIIYRITLPAQPENGEPSPFHSSFESALASSISLPDASAPSQTSPPDFTVSKDDTTVYTNRLLRLRKTLPSAQPNLKAYTYLTTTAFPLFPQELLVNTTLIRLPPALLRAENERLRQLEASSARPKKRHGMYLEESEPYGFLIADMSPHRSASSPILSPPIPGAAVGTGAAEATREVLVEFKPKWVVQSPSAPASWKRCRTCALRSMKAARSGHGESASGFCPLDLASYDESRVRHAVQLILPRHAPSAFVIHPGSSWEDEKAVLEEKVVQFLLTGPLMKVLASLQSKLDPKGPLEADIGPDFLSAMTVRDLTVFLRVDMDGEVQAGIGDLDMKVPKEGKEGYWRDTERRLIQHGWYGGEEEGVEHKQVRWCR